MESNRIIELIKNPEILQISDGAHIEKELAKYPFVQSFQALQLRWKQSFSKEGLEEAIEKLSIYSTHRELIRETIGQLPVPSITIETTVIPKIEEAITENSEKTKLKIDSKEEDNKRKFVETKEELKNTEKTFFVAEETPAISLEESISEEKQTKHVQIVVENKLNINKLGLSYLFSKEPVEETDKPEIELKKEEITEIDENSKIEEDALSKDKILTENVNDEVQETLKPQVNPNLEEKTVVLPSEAKENKENLTVAEQVVEKDDLEEIDISDEDDFSEIIEDTIKKEEKHTLEIINPDTENNKVKEEIVVEEITPIEKLTFNQWLLLSNEKSQANIQEEAPAKEKQKNTIEKFIESNPKISIQKKEAKTKLDIGFKKEEIQDIANLMTVTLAELYIEQGKYDTAMTAFKILSLKYPEKSSYFALKIREIKKIKNSK